MIQHFRRPLASLAVPAVKACPGNPRCKCCAAMQRARELALFDPLPEWASPLTAGVQLVNLSHTVDGRNLRVTLGSDWPRMFRQLAQVGDGLVMTRNAAAIIGRRMPYPALNVTAGGAKAASGECGLWLDFRHMGAARAVHLRRETGHVFGVEFADAAGHAVHRFTLTPESEMDEFFAWVRLHQACTADQPAVWHDGEAESELAGPARASRSCEAGALLSIVAACVERAVPLRATVRSAAVTQRVEFQPRSLQPGGEWWFATDDVAGLHFQPAQFACVSLDQQPRDNGSDRVAVRGMTADGSTALILEAADPAAEDAWQALLETAA